jgi:hypothetical protein
MLGGAHGIWGEGLGPVGANRRTAFLLVRFLWRSKENELALKGEIGVLIQQ